MTMPERKSDSHIEVVLYTRQGCHLCEQVLEVLQSHGIMPRLHDIDTDPALQDRYGMTIPVIEINGRERFRGAVSPVLLRRLLQDIDGGGD